MFNLPLKKKKQNFPTGKGIKAKIIKAVDKTISLMRIQSLMWLQRLIAGGMIKEK